MALFALHTLAFSESLPTSYSTVWAPNTYIHVVKHAWNFLTKKQETAILLSLMGSDSAEEASQFELKVYKAQ